MTTTTIEQTTTTASPPEDEVTVIKDIVYLEMDGHEYLVDVYAPAGEGPWPVVVALHGATVYKNDSTNTVVAKAAAEAGMLVFAPNWVAAWPTLSDMNAEFVRSTQPALSCALAFAQQQAVWYDGDPDRTVVYGMSGGGSSGHGLVLAPTVDLTPGCLAQTPPVAPVGAVLGDAEYFNHPEWWDGAFDQDIEEMQTLVAEKIDPAFWTADLPSRFRLWAAADGSFPRSFDDPWDEDGWFAQRDPDGSIREDLDDLGELDDGVINYIDSGLLLFTRLQREGVDATFDVLPGGHTTADKVPELVAYLLDAAGTGDESPFAAPAVYEQLARDYCSAWPVVAGFLSDDAGFAQVPGDGLAVPDKGGFAKGISADVVQGYDAVVAALADTDLSTVDCGGPATVSGDWVAMPVSATRSDGSGTEGIWVFRIVKDQVQWHLAYGTEVADVAAASTEPDPALVTEARDFCAIVEGSGYVRSADEFLAAMTDDPLVHNYPEGLYWTGVAEVRSIAPLYPPSDDIWCGSDITTNGLWSAELVTIDNPPLSLVGMMVHHHIDGWIHSQFVHFTRTSGSASWGLPLDE
ncbi:MAG: hypothetical protein U9O18_06340 [Chloroflexota bacterium]|nr:hypothetical protein [Chloroflexota bacterium]